MGEGGNMIDPKNIDNVLKVTMPLMDSLEIRMKESKKEIKEIENIFHEEKKSHMAEGFFERIASKIRKFEAELDEEHQVGIMLANFGQTTTLFIDTISYINPSLIIFGGFDETGNPIELIQHVSQISFLLVKLPRQDCNKPKRRIGFLYD